MNSARFFMRNAALALAVLALGTVESTAHAQLQPETQTGSRIPVKPKLLDPERTGQMVKPFAQCVYQRNMANASRLLENSDPVSVDFARLNSSESEITKLMKMDDCLGLQGNDMETQLGLRFGSQQLRSMMQEEAYLAQHRVAPALSADAVEILPRHFISTGEALEQAKGIAVFADCLVFADTAGSDALLRTMPGSKNERATARELAPALEACLVQGQNLSLKTSNVRILAADGLWNRYVRSTGKP